jgi:threonine dehydrogenase-like Zn-dependent dehydrogenase
LRALYYDGDLKLRQDYPAPRPTPGEALVRVTRAGICNTDLEVVRGYMDFRGVLGHEFVGVVEEVRDPAGACDDAVVERDLRGERVVGEINVYCGECPTCRRGDTIHCPYRSSLGIEKRDGAFADYLVLPVRNLHPVPAGISDEQAIFVEPLAAALEILEQVHITPSDRVIVLGDGKLGLLVAQALALTGCELLALGRHEEKLAILQRRGIATQLADELPQGGADIVVDCTGNPAGFAAARALVRPRGTLVLKSTFHGDATIDLTSLAVDEINLVGSRCGPFVPAVRLLAMGVVDVDSLLHATYPLDEGLRAFAHSMEPGVLKVELTVS